jgi:CO/xanthine dehydrogenase FAD-binding subunit
MQRFTYVRPSSITEAVSLLNEPGLRNRPLAGGTDLVLLARHDPALCDRVVDITMIPELHKIEQRGQRVVIGAGASFSEVIESNLIARTAPVLVQACQHVGAVQIRNMGTLGGNVANAAACADSLPALVCLDAEATVLTPNGEMSWLVTELVRAPNRTLIPPGGLLVSLSYPIPAPGSRSVFIKLGRRNAMAISRLTVAALGSLDSAGRIAEARLVPGSATPQIVHFKPAEDVLLGQIPSQSLYQEAAGLAIEEMARLAGRRWSSEFKEPALTAMIVRALAQIFDDLATAAPSTPVSLQSRS